MHFSRARRQHFELGLLQYLGAHLWQLRIHLPYFCDTAFDFCAAADCAAHCSLRGAALGTLARLNQASQKSARVIRTSLGCAPPRYDPARSTVAAFRDALPLLPAASLAE